MQVVPQLAPESSGCWGAPHWGASGGPLAGEATSAVSEASAWGSGGPCSKEEEVVLTDFGVSMSPTAEAAAALGGGPLGGPPSAVRQDAAICGAWESRAASAAAAAAGTQQQQQRRSCLKAAAAASLHAYRVDRLDQWTRSNLSSSPNDMLSN
ncbi:hypothetical protein Emed_002552 [Eimeria media]